MDKIKRIGHLTGNLLLYEWSDKRVAMGFLAGTVMPFWWLKGFLEYVISRGEPVNILEAFPVIGHSYNSILFLVLGWLLVVSDAPFINGSTYYSLCRTNKRSWNCAMVFYILVQAALYTAAVILPTVLFSLPYGYVGRMWSNPVYVLSQDFGMDISSAYHVAFLRQNMMRNIDVPCAFAVTALCFYLYLVAMGMILYTFNLLLGGIWGTVITFLVHIGGVELPYSGLAAYSLIEYAGAANFIDDNGLHLIKPVAVFFLVGAALFLLENLLIGRVDFRGQ